MRKKKLFIKTILTLIIMLTTICSTITYAHSGRTDKNGGHKDNKNASGLGNYHYHCGGYPAHLHPNGVCKYTGSGKNTSSTNTSSKSNTTTKKNTSTQAKSTKQNTTQETGKTTQQNTAQESNKTINQTTNKVTNQTTNKTSNQTQNSNQKETQTKTKTQTQNSTKTQPKTPTEIPVQTIKITNESNKTELKIGETIKLKTKITPDNATNKTITWISSDEKIATVDSSGTVKAVLDGEVSITAKSNNSKQDTLKLVVKRNPILVEKIVINNLISKMNIGEELDLEVSIMPENADNKGFEISSSNENIVKVVNNKIKAVSSGDAVITIYSKDKNATISMDVSVVEVKIEENYNEESMENKSSLNQNSGNNENSSNNQNSGVVTVAMASAYGGIAYVLYKKNSKH